MHARQCLEEAVDVGVEVLMPELEPVTHREPGDLLGQLFGSGHRAAADQGRNHADIAAQSRTNLEPHVVPRAVDSSTPLLVRSAEPVRTHDGNHDITAADCLINVFAEIDAQRNRIDVHEDMVRPEPLHKPVVDPARSIPRVVPAVAHEDRYPLALLRSIVRRRGTMWRRHPDLEVCPLALDLGRMGRAEEGSIENSHTLQ